MTWCRTMGGAKGYAEFQIDAEDVGRVKRHQWEVRAYQWLKGHGYVRGIRMHGRKPDVWLQRWILRIRDRDTWVDFRNDDGLDFRKENLIVLPFAGTGHCRHKRAYQLGTETKSRWKGVSQNTHSDIWFGRVTFGGRPRHLGSFDKEDDAAIAHNRTMTALGIRHRPNDIEDDGRVLWRRVKVGFRNVKYIKWEIPEWVQGVLQH